MSTPSNVIRTAQAMEADLGKAITDAQETLKRSIRRLEQRIMADFKALETGPAGNLVGPRVNLKQAQAVHKKLIKHFEESYGTGVRRAVKGFNDVAGAIQTNWPDLESAIEYTGADRTVMETLANQAVLEFEQYGAAAQERIATAMYDQVVAGGQFSDLVNEMAAILGTAKDARGNSMARYAELWANDGIMNFHQQVTLNKAKEAGLTMFLYYGNVIKTSRPFCIDRAGKIFSRKEIDSWNEITWQGKSGPPLTYRGGWNCRHHWHPVKKEWIPEGSLQVGDYFDEAGVTIARGNTIPPWPGSKKVATPTPKPKRPKKHNAQYVEPHGRWVPFEDPYSSEADLWAKQILKESEDFMEWSGLGPCGPVVDNIVEVLQANGRNARVMYTQYLPKGAKAASDAYPHYVAVELDDFGRVIRIYDPTNPNVSRAIQDLVPGKLPPEYFPPNSWTRWAPEDAQRYWKDTLTDIAEDNWYGDDIMAQGFMNVMDDAKAQYRHFHGSMDELKGGITYDLEGNDVIIRTMGGLEEGGQSKALLDVVAQASDDGMAVYLRADDAGHWGAETLEELGFLKDPKRGPGWYVADNQDRQLRKIQHKLSSRVDNSIPNPTGIHSYRDETYIFRTNGWARDDGMIYGKDEHEWWYGKLGRPNAAKPQTTSARWFYTSTKTQAHRQMQELADSVDINDTYARMDYGTYEGQHAWRFNHSGDTAAKRYSNPNELDKLLHAKAIISDQANIESINGVGRKFAELQNRSDQLGIPRLRTLNLSGRVRNGVNGSMGDGVLSLNMRTFNSLMREANFDVGGYKRELERFVDDCKAALEAAAAAEGKRSANYLALKEMLETRQAELKLLKEGTWQGPAFGTTGKRSTTSWKPYDGKVGGFPPQGTGMPFNTSDYFDNGMEKALKTMEHEYGHHIHQQLFVNGDTVKLNNPPLERWLEHWFKQLGIDGSTQNVSKYSMENAREWFAENYAMWVAGKKGYVREELRGLMEALDDLAAGKTTQQALHKKMFKGTGFNTEYLPLKARGKYGLAGNLATGAADATVGGRPAVLQSTKVRNELVDWLKGRTGKRVSTADLRAFLKRKYPNQVRSVDSHDMAWLTEQLESQGRIIYDDRLMWQVNPNY